MLVTLIFSLLPKRQDMPVAASEVAMMTLPAPRPAPPPPDPQPPASDVPLSRADPMPLKPRVLPRISPTDVEPLPLPEPLPPPPAAAEPAPVAPPVEAAPAPAAAKQTYAGRVFARIAASKRYPTSSRARREEGLVRVSFSLDRAGRLLEASVTMPSGYGDLDREALATVRRAQPFGQVPNEIPVPLELAVDIEFALSRRALSAAP